MNTACEICFNVKAGELGLWQRAGVEFISEPARQDLVMSNGFRITGVINSGDSLKALAGLRAAGATDISLRALDQFEANR